MEVDFSTQSSPAPDNLQAGEFPRVTKDVTIAGGNYPRGAVLGRVTAGGKLKLSASAAADGSEKPVAVLARAVDASGGDRVAPVYLTGEFAASEITLGTGHTVDSVFWDLAARGIFLKEMVGV
jgi:hypothetical protein